MKKLFTLGFLVLIFASCERKNYLTDKQLAEQNKEIFEVLAEIRGIVGNKTEVQTYIVIDKKHPDMPSDWKSRVANLVSELPNKIEILNKDIITLEANDFYYVDLNLISRLYPKKIADWLKENDKYIKFPESYWLIETAHKVQEKFERDDLDKIDESTYTKVEWPKLKKFMDDESVSLGSVNNYDKFLQINFSVPAPNNLTTTIFDEKPMFSFPLLNSIYMNHGQSATLEFLFVNYIYRGGEKTVILKVKEGQETIGYFDFTHRPRYVINPWY